MAGFFVSAGGKVVMVDLVKVEVIMAAGRSIRLFLAEGIPHGIVTAEIVNWTGHVVSAPRTRLAEALKRDELKRTGIYVLYGGGYGSDLPRVYVGEGDDISQRLYQHSRDENKDFWERFVAVTNKDMNLTKAHVKHLEGRLINLLKEAKKADIANRTEPAFDRLPEADISDMEDFINQMMIVLPVIGIDFFRKPSTQKPEALSSSVVDDVVFELRHARKGILAKAREVDGEFIVLAGSQGDVNESKSFHDKARNQREQLLKSGRISLQGESNFVLSEDVAFSSPSAASVFLFGTSRNGRTDWLVQGASQTYGDWKDAALAPDPREGA